MPSQTPNRGYGIPDAGQTDWHTIMNPTLESIDQDMQQALEGGGGGGGGGWSGDSVINDGWTTLGVGDGRDYDSIQAAVDDAMIINANGAVTIEVEDGTYDEDVVVGPYISGSTDGGHFRIVGNRENPTNVQVRSMAWIGCIGPAVGGFGLSVQQENSFISSGAGIYAYACIEVRFDDIAFAPTNGTLESGIEAYSGSVIDVRNIDISGTQHGVKAKRGATALIHSATGSADWHGYWATEGGSVWFLHDSSDISWGGSPWQDRIIRTDAAPRPSGSSDTTYMRNVQVYDLEATGSKNWVHPLDDGREIVYSSHEGTNPRGVWEDEAVLTDGETTVELPTHFDDVTSDTDPRVQTSVTPHELATVAVTEKSTSELTLAADRDVTVDYHVSAVRDGFEDTETYRYPDGWDEE